MKNMNSSCLLYHLFGMDTSIKRNIVTIHHGGNTPNEILYLAGKYIVKVDMESRERKYALVNSNCDRFGCMIVYEDTIYVGEVGPNSSILICNLSDLRVLGALKGGLDDGYSCLDVSKNGKFLCSIGIKPDHSLIVWDLEKMTIMLQTKARGQDIYYAAFSPHDCSIITTAGKGHVRFWKIAETFTGLKLQGKFGKFKKEDVCNVESLLYLQNGTILSGSDSGFLLLWKDGVLKCTFVLGDIETIEKSNTRSGEPCPIHKGGVNCLYYDDQNQKILTAGADGSIKWWQHDVFVTTKLGECANSCTVLPIKSISLNSGVSNITHIIPFHFNNFIAQDSYGKMFMIDFDKDLVSVPWKFHGGKITGIDVSPKEHLYVTCGEDGSVHFCNYLQKKNISSTWFSSSCTQILWCPKEVDNTQRSFVVGFNDGSIKFLYASDEKILVLQSIRPHKKNVMMINFRPCGSLLATSDDTGEVFIFKCNEIRVSQKVAVPLCCIDCTNSIISSIMWQQSDKKALQYTSIDGRQMEIDLEAKLVSEEKAMISNDITMTYRLLVHETVFEIKTCVPFANEVTHRGVKSLNRKSFDGEFFITTCSNGIVSVFRKDKHFIDKKMIFTSKDDDRTSLLPQFTFSCIDEGKLPSDVDFSSENSCLYTSDDINPHEGQPENGTIEELLTKQCNDSKQINATKKKNCIRRVITDMRTELLSIRQLNSSLPSNVKLPHSEFILNSFFNIMYEDILQRKILEVIGDNDGENKRSVSQRRKIEEIFLDNLETDLEIVSGLKSGNKVHSFPLWKLDYSFIHLGDSRSIDGANDTQREVLGDATSNDRIHLDVSPICARNLAPCNESIGRTGKNRKVRRIWKQRY